MTNEQMLDVLNKYFKAWEDQDTEALVSLFSTYGVYRVKPFTEEEYHGIKEIRQYWDEHPVTGQTNPKPQIISYGFGERVCFAEWKNDFINRAGNNKTTYGMWLLEFEEGKIKELRELYQSLETQ